MIHFGVDQILHDSVKFHELEVYPSLSEISPIAYMEFLIDIIRTKDKALFDHMKGVKIFTTLLARLCFEENLIDSETLEDTVFASFFHDLGKLFIPENILHKPSSLTKSEFEFMKQHTTLGASLFEKILRTNSKNRTFTTLYHVTKYHHERYDGKGYPCGLAGDQIPVAARIVAITDVFQALTSNRSYRDAYDFEKALQIIEEDEGHFDPQICQVFLENINLFKL
ncbi:MAG: HD domain-containing phosphohydrolase [Pseudothermotoga sp.]